MYERNLENLKGDVRSACGEHKVTENWMQSSVKTKGQFDLNARMSVSNRVLASRARKVGEALAGMGWEVALRPGIVPHFVVQLGRNGSGKLLVSEERSGPLVGTVTAAEVAERDSLNPRDFRDKLHPVVKEEPEYSEPDPERQGQDKYIADSEAFDEAQVKDELPPGWTILERWQMPHYPHLELVLAWDPANKVTPYVVWTHNKMAGGYSTGDYAKDVFGAVNALDYRMKVGGVKP